VRDPLITVQVLASLVGAHDLLIIDARDPTHYLQGHIPGAINLCPSELESTLRLSSGAEIPHTLVEPDRAAATLGARGIHHNTRVCIYDEGGSYRAARLWWILDYLGHPLKALLDGGFALWEAETAAVEMQPQQAGPATFYPAPRPPLCATFADVIGYIDNPRVTLCNALPEQSFAERTLPSSISVPYTLTYVDSERPLLRSRHELARMLAGQGVSPDTHVVCFCGVGYTAAQLYFAVRLAGYQSVALYDGSMTDWSARGGDLVPGRRSLD
jgi:thiosulfate/3-mercaptopyruvate sulfurtransferase